MLAARRGYVPARSMLSVARRSRLAALAADRTAIRLQGATSGSGGRWRGNRDGASAQVSRQRSGGSAPAPYSAVSGEHGYSSEGGVVHGENNGRAATAVSGARGGGGVRRAEWLEYQSMLQERAGLLQRRQPTQAVGTHRGGNVVPGDVAGTLHAVDATMPAARQHVADDAPSTAAAAPGGHFGAPCGNDVRATQSSTSEHSITDRIDRDGAVVETERSPSSRVSAGGAESPILRSPWETTIEAGATGAAETESERAFGKLGRRSRGRKAAGRAEEVGEEPPNSTLFAEEGPVRGHLIRGEASQRYRAGRVGGVAQEAIDVAHRSDFNEGGALLSELEQLFEGRKEQREESLSDRRERRPNRGAMVEVGNEQVDAGGAPMSQLEQLFGKPTPAGEALSTNGRAGQGQFQPAALSTTPLIASTDDQTVAAAATSAPRARLNSETSQLEAVRDTRSVHEDESRRNRGSPSEHATARVRRRLGQPADNTGRGESSGGGSRSRGRKRSAVSHSGRAGSAWKNVHARVNLKALLAGLAGDYGVQELLNDHHVHEVRFASFLASSI